MSSKHKIVHLPREQWRDTVLPGAYTTTAYYDVSVETETTGWTVALTQKVLDKPATHRYSDTLYAAHWPEACAWGVLEEGRLVAAIETCPEEWSNRLRVTELWVDEPLRGQGIGPALMAVAREQAQHENRRAIILETQSSNIPAIGFYLHEGFFLIGLDTCCYHNDDIARGEVRMELGWFPARKERLPREAIEIRPERPEEYQAVEWMLQQAFWNKYQPGSDIALLVHKLRNDGAYLPELSRIAVKDGEIIGAIVYSLAWVQDGDKRHEVLTFGPLGVSPAWRGSGVGEMLLRETMQLAAEAGYPGIIILGEPDYYPRAGFQPCETFGITSEGEVLPGAFMGIELRPGAFRDIRGEFHESPLFEDLPPPEVEAHDKRFPPLEKQYFPKQFS